MNLNSSQTKAITHAIPIIESSTTARSMFTMILYFECSPFPSPAFPPVFWGVSRVGEGLAIHEISL